MTTTGGGSGADEGGVGERGGSGRRIAVETENAQRIVAVGPGARRLAHADAPAVGARRHDAI